LGESAAPLNPDAVGNGRELTTSEKSNGTKSSEPLRAAGADADRAGSGCGHAPIPQGDSSLLEPGSCHAHLAREEPRASGGMCAVTTLLTLPRTSAGPKGDGGSTLSNAGGEQRSHGGRGPTGRPCSAGILTLTGPGVMDARSSGVYVDIGTVDRASVTRWTS
jgi:hypothetical protein